MGVDHHNITACMHYVVFNVWPVFHRKQSMSCFTKAGFVLKRLAMPKHMTIDSKPKFQDITLTYTDNQNIQNRQVILVAISHVHEDFKGSTNIVTLSST